MGYILCGREARHPFFLPDLGKAVRSSEELCYYIREHTEMLTEDFFSEELLRFLAEELEERRLAEELRLKTEKKRPFEELLGLFLREIAYLSEEEIRNVLLCYQDMSGVESSVRTFRKARRLRELGRFRPADTLLQSLLQKGTVSLENRGILEGIYEERAVNAISLGYMERAFAEYRKAYAVKKSHSILKKLYLLSLLHEERKTEADERLFADLPDASKVKLVEELRKAREEAEFLSESSDTAMMFRKRGFRRDSELYAALMEEKKEYRQMIAGRDAG